MNRERLGDNAIKINTRDRLLRAWENSMEMVLDFQDYYQEIKDNVKWPRYLRSLPTTRPCTPDGFGNCSTSARTTISSSNPVKQFKAAAGRTFRPPLFSTFVLATRPSYGYNKR